MKTSLPPSLRHRGDPLLTLVLVIVGWVILRAAAWEDPFAPAVAAQQGAGPALPYAPQSLADPLVLAASVSPDGAFGAQARRLATPRRARPPARGVRPSRLAPDAVEAPEAVPAAMPPPPSGPASSLPPPSAALGEGDAGAAFVSPPHIAPRRTAPGRWSVDVWGFWRQGSDAAPVSQGRVPTYGASQAGAVLQYRLAPANRHDPRLYARAYRALVTRGESELSLGGSIRPLPGVPLRLAGEGRYTDSPFGSELRPAAYAVTEINPVALPLATRLEVYGQAGWVGGRAKTAFADGQASLTHALPFAGRLSKDALRVSLGAGAWGGAQKDAQRLDVGPTLRTDLKIGRVPARLSFDWRQRVAGDAAPGSGVAATLSAGF